MSEETYNGWTNRETWAVALHINNDQGWQESVLEDLATVRDEYREPGCDACEDGETHALPAHKAGDAIRENVESAIEGMLEAGLPAYDIVKILQDIGSMWRVNWTELGASFLSDLEDN